MRTTLTGALLAPLALIAFVVVIQVDYTAWTLLRVLTYAFLAGVGCLIVGPILWIRGAHRARVEELALLRQIAAQGTPPTA